MYANVFELASQSKVKLTGKRRTWPLKRRELPIVPKTWVEPTCRRSFHWISVIRYIASTEK